MSSLVRRALAAACAALLATAASGAQASPSAKLVYVRGPGAEICPGEAELRKAVATRIGYDPFFLTAQKTVIAQVTRVATGYRGRVQIIGDDGIVRGERELGTKGDDCAELVSTMALAVSIALDDLDEAAPGAAPAPDTPPTAAPSSPAAAPAPEDGPEPRRVAALASPSPSAPAGPRVELAASMGPTLSLGTAPAAAVGGSFAATLQYGLVGLRFTLRGELPASGPIVPTGILSTHIVLATLAGCVRGKIPFGCVGGGIGSLASSTEGIARPASDSGRLVVLVATAGADVPLGPFLYLEPFVEGAASLVPQRVEVDGKRAFSLPVASGTLGLHLGGHFL